MTRFDYDCSCFLISLVFGCSVTVNHSFELWRQQMIQAALNNLLPTPPVGVLVAIVKSLNNAKEIQYVTQIMPGT
jgi:hypothetical protein